jgi:DNA-binding IclR family transcriptional regulator
MNKQQIEKQNSVQSIDRAVRIMDVLAAGEIPLQLSEISRQVEIPASTTHRLLASLQQHGYVRFDSSQRKYTLGLAVLSLAEAAKSQIDITKEAMPILEKLAASLNVTANLTVLQNDEAVYTLRAASTRTIGTITPLGRRVPFHCTAAGKTMLAYLPEESRDRILNLEHKAHTRNSITNSYQLLDELAKIRASGVGFDNEEYELGMRCIAAPVFDHKGQITATVGISGPSSRITPERDEELALPVQVAASELSSYLGHIKI